MAIEMQQILLTMLFAFGFFMLNIWMSDEARIDIVIRVIAFWMMIVSILWAVFLALRWMVL